MKTAEEMAAAPNPRPETEIELLDYVRSVIGAVKYPPETAQGIRTPAGDEAYSMTVHAIGLAAMAAYHYAAHKLRPTGYQASAAGIEMLRRTHNIEGPFAVVQASNMLYPQTANVVEDVAAFLREPDTQNFLHERAKKLLIDNRITPVHHDVLAHWTRLAANRPAFPPTPGRVNGEEHHG